MFQRDCGCYSSQASSTAPKFNKTASGKLKRVDHYKKNESRKHERLYFERKLQSNLDQYVTRAVTELVYRTPDDLADVGDDDEDAEERGNRGEGGSQDGTHPLGAHNGGAGAHHRDSVHATSAAPAALADVMAQERFPIPMEVRKRHCARTMFQPLWWVSKKGPLAIGKHVSERTLLFKGRLVNSTQAC